MNRAYLTLIIIAGVLNLACSTKVSEWVLINSLPNRYTLVYLHSSSLSEEEREQQTRLKTRFELANIDLGTVQQDGIEKPYYALYFNNQLIERYRDEKDLIDITTSPKRREIANELMEGKLCVMIYLKCGVPERDRDGLQELTRSIKESPFRDAITVLELERESPEEVQFVSGLLNIESDLKEIKEPMLFGIFGRLRALEPLMAMGITQKNINLMIDFFTADCSCLIKDALPGRSILYSGTWDNPHVAQVNTIMDKNPHLEHQ